MDSAPLLDGNGGLDLRKLRRELAHAMEEDATLSRVDEAKKRAVRTARSYDEFKNLVACARLKPVSRRDIDGLGQPKQGWQAAAAVRSRSAAAATAAMPTMTMPAASSILSSAKSVQSKGRTAASAMPPAMAFERSWRQLPSDDAEGRLSLLHNAGGAAFIRGRLSKGALSPELLGEVIEAMAAATTGTKTSSLPASETLGILDALAQTARFSVHRALLTRKQRAMGQELAAWAAREVEEGRDEATMERVREAFS